MHFIEHLFQSLQRVRWGGHIPIAIFWEVYKSWKIKSLPDVRWDTFYSRCARHLQSFLYIYDSRPVSGSVSAWYVPLQRNIYKTKKLYVSPRLSRLAGEIHHPRPLLIVEERVSQIGGNDTSWQFRSNFQGIVCHFSGSSPSYGPPRPQVVAASSLFDHISKRIKRESWY